MSKHVLLVGVLGVAFFIAIWLVFTVFPILPDTGIAPLDSVLHSLRHFAAINGYTDHNPFTRTSPFFKLWFACMLIAIVSDAFIRPAAKRAVSAFAALLSNEVGQVGCKVRSEYHDQRKPPRAADYRARVPAAQNFVPEAGDGLPRSVGA